MNKSRKTVSRDAGFAAQFYAAINAMRMNAVTRFMFDIIGPALTGKSSSS
ncbi:hypothetical protein [Aquisediminimonas sediminicola]|nr:hypothetical protein [Aquisediminimonas sediminicola]